MNLGMGAAAWGAGRGVPHQLFGRAAPPPAPVRKITKRTEANVSKVRAMINEDPRQSLRKLSRGAGLKIGTVRNILKKDVKKKCVKTVSAHKVTKTSAQKRLEKCIDIKKQIESGSLDPKKIFFTDEKQFVVGDESQHGSQNYRIWVDADVAKKDIAQDLIVRGKKQGGARVMVSMGVCYNGAGTVQFVEKGVKIDQASYLAVVKNVYQPDMEILIGDGYVLQQDGAPSHTAKSVLQWIKNEGKFEVLKPWPANSPDLNPMDYGIWGILEPLVFAQNPKSEVELKTAIRKAVPSLTPATLQSTVLQFEKRLDLCIANNGGNFEYKI